MAQNANNSNPITYSHCKDYMNVLLGKILKREIFTTKEIVGAIRNNNRALDQMDLQEKLKLIESLDEVSALNSDFKDLKTQFLCETTDDVNIKNFKQYIRKTKSGFYYDKAKNFLFIRSLFIIPQFLFFLILLFIIIASDSFEEVYIIKFCLRGSVLIVDIVFYICGYNALKKLERLKIDNIYNFLIIVLQLTKFISMVIIFVIDLLRNNYKTSPDNKNLFLLNNIIMEKIENAYDLLQFLI